MDMKAMHCRPLSRLAPLILFLSCGGQEGTAGGLETYIVQRGDLQMLVREHGEIQPGQSTRIASELDGDAVLIYLIPEGTRVEVGEKLVELDVSEIRDKEANQAIKVAKAEAVRDQAKKNFEIMEEGLNAALTSGQSSLRIAQLRAEKFIGEIASAERPTMGASEAGTNASMVTKLRELLDEEVTRNPLAEANYGDLVEEVMERLRSEDRLEDNLRLEMGEMANLVLRKIDDISLAWADLQLATDKLRHSEDLFAQQFITKNELETDDITHQRQLSNITLAWNDLELLIKFTLKETKIQLAQNVSNAELALQNTIATNDASRVREESMLGSAEAEFALHDYILGRFRGQIDKGIITSPTPGVVVYTKGRGGRMGRNSLEEGSEVRRRQEIINLPDVSQMGVDFSVHEAQIERVAASQRVVVTVDAFPERVFTGTVARVGALPDSTARYNNNDLKVYRAWVDLDGDNADGSLRPGMNAEVEIMVQSVTDAILVPLTAIQLERSLPYVWKVTREGPVAQWVRFGASNLDHAEILEGLDEGEEIYLGVPPGSVPPAFGRLQDGSAAFNR